VDFDKIGDCPICDKASFLIWPHCYDRQHRISNFNFTYLECQFCKVLFLAERPLQNNMVMFYPQDYAPYAEIENKPGTKSQTHKNFIAEACEIPGRILRFIFNRKCNKAVDGLYNSADGLLVDYGCGSPKFLDKAKSIGWETIGVDFTNSLVNQIRESGHQAHLSDNLDNEISDNSIGLFRLSQAFEHLYNPNKILALILRKLRFGGNLHISMPNPQGFSARIFRRYWFGLECPRHIILYPHQIIKKLVQNSGFINAQIFGEFLSKDFIRSCGYGLTQKGYMRPQQAVELHTNYMWDFASNPALLVSYGLQRPDRYHLIANKA